MNGLLRVGGGKIAELNFKPNLNNRSHEIGVARQSGDVRSDNLFECATREPGENHLRKYGGCRWTNKRIGCRSGPCRTS